MPLCRVGETAAHLVISTTGGELIFDALSDADLLRVDLMQWRRRDIITTLRRLRSTSADPPCTMSIGR